MCFFGRSPRGIFIFSPGCYVNDFTDVPATVEMSPGIPSSKRLRDVLEDVSEDITVHHMLLPVSSSLSVAIAPVVATPSPAENLLFPLSFFRGSPKPPAPRLTRACLTVLRVLHEWGLGGSSPFHPYLSVLPRDHRLPLEWNDEELELLQVLCCANAS